MLTIGSLFSGIGGLELGLERAGLGPVLWQVEIDPFARQVLAKHWPNVKRHEDVRAVGADLERVDLICGGFPCQDVSSAGKRAGMAGHRSGLWREFVRVVEEITPPWVVVENVASGATAWVDRIQDDLEKLDYASLPIPLSASDVGAPHRRARIFVVANAYTESKPARTKHAKVASASKTTADTYSKPVVSEPKPKAEHQGWISTANQSEPGMVRMVHGVRDGMDRRRIASLGNTVVPQCAEVIGWVVRELAGVA